MNFYTLTQKTCHELFRTADAYLRHKNIFCLNRSDSGFDKESSNFYRSFNARSQHFRKMRAKYFDFRSSQAQKEFEIIEENPLVSIRRNAAATAITNSSINIIKTKEIVNSINQNQSDQNISNLHNDNYLASFINHTNHQEKNSFSINVNFF